MEERTARTLQLIAKAFASSSTHYNVTVAPHPTAPHTYEVLFSLPTAEAPESPTFVALSLTELEGEAPSRRFRGLLEHQSWPLTVFIDGDGQLIDFPHGFIDIAWEHKQCVSRAPLWVQ